MFTKVWILYNMTVHVGNLIRFHCQIIQNKAGCSLLLMWVTFKFSDELLGKLRLGGLQASPGKKVRPPPLRKKAECGGVCLLSQQWWEA
jgi:hypothetical protein